MLPKDASGVEIKPIPLAFVIYDQNGKVSDFNDRLSELFPVFKKLDVIGLTQQEIRDLLKAVNKTASTHVGQMIAAKKLKPKDGLWHLGTFDLGDGRFCAIDDIPMPDGGCMSVVRDLSERKRDLDTVVRLENAVSELANEEAIYNGSKEAAYQIMTEVAARALHVSRADVWLMNVDGTVLCPQESFWVPTGEHIELQPIEKETAQQVFVQLAAGEMINVPHICRDSPLRILRSIDGAQGPIESILMVPVMRGPRVVGAISVAHENETRLWNHSEIAFVSYLGDLVLHMLEAHDRQVAEEGLRGFNELLDMKVKKRTRDLEEAMETLKLAQEELVRSEKMASLGGLVAGVAHEINTPLGVALTSITHLAEALSGFERAVQTGKVKKSELTNFMETADESTTVIQRNLERAAHLVRSFKMVAVDQSVSDVREIDVGDYIHEIVDSLTPTLRTNGVRVHSEAEGGLRMKTVPGDLSHILTNLIMNAALHGFSDCPDKKNKDIYVTAKRNKGLINLEVKDNGRGIPSGIREKIFEPFFTTARNRGGSGLGLNIVYNTVYHKLGGTIDVGAACGGGACFFISLPIDYKQPV